MRLSTLQFQAFFRLKRALSLVERHLGDTTRSVTYRHRSESMSMSMNSLDLQISGKRLPLPEYDELVGNRERCNTYFAGRI
jgi:hypothetical protein